MKYLTYLLLIAVSVSILTHTRLTRKHMQKVKDIPPTLIAGQIHYSRIPVEYWQHRLMMIKSMGFNALSVYMMWNYHEVQKGKFDYQTQNKNITLFLQLAKKHNFYVLIRPGPYVCAQWDMGGFPARLYNIPGLILRANEPKYLAQVRQYLQSVAEVTKKYLASNGGPIVMLQIQNQYGFYGSDKSYMQSIRAMWRDFNYICAQYYVDTVYNIEKCHWSGANIGINDGKSEQQYVFVRSIQPKGFIFGGEIYSGWLTHWGQKFQGKNITQYTKQFQTLLSYNHSFSMYMVHGGSNFGLTAGANYDKAFGGQYKGHITSYDYDAPINEQGSPNQKFYIFRNLVKKYLNWTLPEPPANLPVISIPAFRPLRFASIFGNLPEPTFKNYGSIPLFESNQLKMFNQGFVLYQTQLASGSHNLSINVHDFGIIYLDDKYVTNLDRSKAIVHKLTLNCNTSCKLFILVQAMGHINFDHQMTEDRKGLFSFNDSKGTKYLWNIYKIPIDKSILNWRGLDNKAFPALLRASFALNKTGDVFFNMKNYKKGYVFVNGRNLGRYWNIGPSQKIFCPGVWLKQGNNQIFILQLLTSDTFDITGDETLKSQIDIQKDQDIQ